MMLNNNILVKIITVKVILGHSGPDGTVYIHINSVLLIEFIGRFRGGLMVIIGFGVGKRIV
jgi:hypothetical protein